MCNGFESLLGKVGLYDGDQLGDLLLGALDGHGLVADDADDEAAVGELNNAHGADAGIGLDIHDEAVLHVVAHQAGVDLQMLAASQKQALSISSHCLSGYLLYLFDSAIRLM